MSRQTCCQTDWSELVFVSGEGTIHQWETSADILDPSLIIEPFFFLTIRQTDIMFLQYCMSHQSVMLSSFWNLELRYNTLKNTDAQYYFQRHRGETDAAVRSQNMRFFKDKYKKTWHQDTLLGWEQETAERLKWNMFFSLQTKNIVCLIGEKRERKHWNGFKYSKSIFLTTLIQYITLGIHVCERYPENVTQKSTILCVCHF